MPDQETLTSIGTSIGYLVAGALAAAAAYIFGRPKPPQPHAHDAVLTGVGLEWGNREQMERLIEQVKRIADTLDDKSTAGINDRLDDLTAIVEKLLAESQRRRPQRR